MEKTDYSSYVFCRRERLIYSIEGIACLVIIAFLFYRSVWFCALGIVVAKWWFQRKKKQCIRRRQTILAKEFREAMQSVAGALYAGYSLENAWREAQQEMQLLYGAESCMVRELKWMNARLALGESFEKLLEDFADRSGLEDVRNFYHVLRFAKKSGGDFIKILQVTVSRIGDKIQVYAQIETVMAAKQLEQRIMCVVPLGILLYIGVGSPEYLEVLYHNLLGVLIMSGCLSVYLLAILMGERITAIEI